ncbi:MAG: isoprenylcysteine carboxylmethyltransferase family protein [Gemmatimonadaceae bacterium]
MRKHAARNAHGAQCCWLAVLLLVPVLAFFAWRFRTLGANYRGGVGLYDNHALVRTGPYRLIRHPIYSAFIAIMLLVLPLSANWVLGLSGLLLVVSIAAARIPIEVRQLHEQFGKSREVYRDRVGLFFPRFRK